MLTFSPFIHRGVLYTNIFGPKKAVRNYPSGSSITPYLGSYLL